MSDADDLHASESHDEPDAAADNSASTPDQGSVPASKETKTKTKSKAAASKEATERAKADEAANAEALRTAGMDWYILKVAFNREDTVREAIIKQIKMSGSEDKFGQVLVPTEDVAEFTRSGKRKIVKRKLYPGYLMLQMELDDDTWFLIRETTGVSDFTGTAGKPMPMDPDEVERIIKASQPDEEDETPIKTAIPFREGDRVRCKEGYFQNLEGDVDKVDEANGRITVIISIFGRSTPVELDHWQVEPV